MKKSFTQLLDRDRIFLWLAYHGFLNHMPDDKYLRRRFQILIGHPLDLDNPKSFNEKLQWLKLYDHRPEYTMMVDKYAVKQYVADMIGAEHVVPTLGVWDRFDEIDFDKLPAQFVLKCTHDSGGLVICRDKSRLDVQAARKKINDCLKRNYYNYCREWPYKNVKPRVFAEQYMEDGSSPELIDYKFMCFDGRVRCSFVCSERFSGEGLKVTFFDLDWNVMPFERHYPKSEKPIPKPKTYEKMLELAEKLSAGIPFVRVDFYEVHGQVYFGELTFYPGSGMEEFTPEEWDYTLGSWITLPEKT